LPDIPVIPAALRILSSNFGKIIHPVFDEIKNDRQKTANRRMRIFLTFRFAGNMKAGSKISPESGLVVLENFKGRGLDKNFKKFCRLCFEL